MIARFISGGYATLIEKLTEVGHMRHLPRGTVLFRQGDKTSSLFFIKEGLVKAYYETIDGKEFIKSFVSEGGSIASMQAIFAANPCSFTVVSLEDSTVLEVPQQTLLGLISAKPDLVRQFNTMLLTLAMKKERREYEFLCLTPEQRYLAFCEREPELIERLTQQDIARYLGITPVALSRIRKRCGFIGLAKIR